MEVEIVSLEEGVDIDVNGRFYRYKLVRFRVDGVEHTLRISMKDFNEGRTEELVMKEAEKIAKVMGKKIKL